MEDIFLHTPHDIYVIQMDIEGAEINILENLVSIPDSVQCLVVEWSFDFATLKVRLQKVIDRLETWFQTEFVDIQTKKS